MEMKKVITIGVLSLFVLGAAYWAYLWIKDLIFYERYVNVEEGISMKYPKGWKVIPKPDTGAIVAFLKPKDNAFVLFQANWNISLTRLAVPLTLDQYVKAANDQMKFTFADLESTAEPVTLSGHKGYKLVYISRRSDGLMFITYVFIYNNVAYNITYADMKDVYLDKKKKQIIADVIGSLKVNF